jgi:O-antigen/teichoic acid export membrane protein
VPVPNLAGGDPVSTDILRSDARVFRQVPVLALFTAGSSLVSALVYVFSARWLGPDRYGEAQAVLLAYALGGLFQLGVFANAARTAVHQRGTGAGADAVRVQNVGLTAELVISIIPGIIMALVAPFLSNPTLVLGFALAPIALGLSSLAGFLGGLEVGYGRAARATVISTSTAAVAGLLTLAAISPIGPAAMFVAPMVGSLLAVVWLAPRLVRVGLRWKWDLKESLRLTRGGLPLAVNGIAYWCYRWIGPTSVAIALGSVALAAYSVAVAPLTFAFGLLVIGARLFLPGFWQDMARGERARWRPEGDRLTSSLALAAAGAATVGQVLFPTFIDHVLPHYTAAIPLFAVLALEIPLFLIPQVPSFVLDSVAANRQGLHAILWVAMLGVNVVANIVVLAAGLGMQAVAWNDVVIQAVMLIALFVAARPYQGPLVGRLAELRGTVGALVLTVVVGGTLALTTTAGVWSGTRGLVARCLIGAAGWAVLGAVLAVLARSRPATPPAPLG